MTAGLCVLFGVASFNADKLQLVTASTCMYPKRINER